MKLVASTLLSALAATVVPLGWMTFVDADPNDPNFFSVFLSEFAYVLVYVAVVGTVLNFVLKRKKADSYFAYVSAGGAAGVVVLALPIVSVASIGELATYRFYVPMLFCSGCVAGAVYRLCIGTVRMKATEA